MNVWLPHFNYHCGASAQWQHRCPKASSVRAETRVEKMGNSWLDLDFKCKYRHESAACQSLRFFTSFMQMC